MVQLLQAFANKLRAEGYATKKGVQVRLEVPTIQASHTLVKKHSVCDIHVDAVEMDLLCM